MAKNSLKEVICGIWILGIVVILAGVFITGNPLAYVLGELVGSLTATIMMIHLYRSIDIELDLPEKKAVNHSKMMSILRNVMELLVLIGSIFISEWVMPITVFTGLFGRKAAAMLVPIYHELKKDNNVNQN